MLLGALLDLGASLQSTRESVRTVRTFLRGCKSIDLVTAEVKRGEFRAKRAEIKVKEDYETRTGAELLEAVREVSGECSFDRFQLKLALNSISTLVDAEAVLHGEKPEDVGLAEAGSADTVADIIGVVSALGELGIGTRSEVYSLPIAVGGGLFKFSHGIVQSPAPAVIGIVSRYRLPLVGGPVQAELATPTGVSLLANLVKHTGTEYPAFTPDSVGYGAGKRDFSGFPNVLRAILGSENSVTVREWVALLETNLDDVTGETLGFLSERLLDEGALDVTMIPAFGKKNRPVQILRVISKPVQAEKLMDIIFEETGTLGVRMFEVMREVASRETRKVKLAVGGKRMEVRVKLSKSAEGRIIRVKPEYEDIARLSRRFKVPLQKLSELAIREAEGQLQKE